jgi:hypothetical protein
VGSDSLLIERGAFIQTDDAVVLVLDAQVDDEGKVAESVML